MKVFLIFASILFTFHLFSQDSCKKIILEVCIDGQSRLHIKGGKLFWEHISFAPPGTHEQCVGLTKMNGFVWKDWKLKLPISFNTDNSTLETYVIKKHDISQLLQEPSTKNGWETIWEFNDPSGSSHYYSVSFTFCEIKKQNTKKAKEVKKEIARKDTVKPKEVVIDLPSCYKIYFESSKTTLTKLAETELADIFENLKNNSTIVEIFGYSKNESDKSDALKLYNERAMTICNFLIGKGLDQKRIQYIGYGDKNLPNEKNKKRIELKILE